MTRTRLLYHADDLAEFDQQIVDLFHFDIVGVEEEPVVFDVRFDAKFLAGVLVFGVGTPVVAVPIATVIGFFFLGGGHDEFDRAGNVVGLQTTEGTNIKLSSRSRRVDRRGT